MKINIEQRKKFIALAPLLAAAVILSSFFVWQFRLNINMREDLAVKKKEFRHAEAASKHLRDLEKKINDIKQKEEMLFRRVPVNEKEPLSLIRALIRLGGKTGLRGITINLKDKTLLVQGEALQRRRGAVQPAEGASDEAPAEQAAAPSEAAAQETAIAPQSGPSPVYLQMEFEGSFPQLLSFLDKLMNLERIVKIEGMSVQRKKEILPYQKVSLDLVTYTF
jgi:Tfp pilus assembly protein PilO